MRKSKLILLAPPVRSRASILRLVEPTRDRCEANCLYANTVRGALTTLWYNCAGSVGTPGRIKTRSGAWTAPG